MLLSVKLSRGNVGFIALRGIGNLSYYAARETLRFLQNRNVEITFLIDRDERAASEIKNIKEALGPEVVFFPTEPRELENYLLVPDAIAQYITEPRGDGPPVRTEEIAALLESKANDLKGHTILKHLCHRLRPIYPNRQMPDRASSTDECMRRFRKIVAGMHEAAEGMQKDLETIHEQTVRDLEDRWDREKLKVVPGTELLDEVFKVFGLRFVKLRDGPGLAAKLGVNAIDSELAAILHKLGS